MQVSDNDDAEQEVEVRRTEGQLTVFERMSLGDSDLCLVQSNWLQKILLRQMRCFGQSLLLGVLGVCISEQAVGQQACSLPVSAHLRRAEY